MTRIGNILCLAIIVAIYSSAIATDYCKLSCRIGRTVYKHTMCQFKSSDTGSSCVDPKARGLSDDEKDRIVKKHNELRKKVASGQEKKGSPGPQPAAESMPNLTWDDEIEKIAQKWCDQCTFGHDKCRRVKKYSVGQNAAMTMMPGENNSPVEDMVQDWYNEVAKLDKDQVDHFNPDNFGEVGHYTQLVWAGSTKIGCGRINYKQNNMQVQMLICNYGPAGNVLNQKMYKKK